MNHYEWLQKWLPTISKNLKINEDLVGAITADGDKCYSWEDQWKNLGIPFPHGVAMYILSKTSPWHKEVRNAPAGWVDVYNWTVSNYPKFKQYFPTEDLEHWTF